MVTTANIAGGTNGRTTGRITSRNHTGSWRGQPSISSISFSTNTMANMPIWWMPSRSVTQILALGDDGTNDLIVRQVLRTNELQMWFLSEHLVTMPLTKAVE